MVRFRTIVQNYENSMNAWQIRMEMCKKAQLSSFFLPNFPLSCPKIRFSKTYALILLNKRGLVWTITSPRRNSNEGSLEKQRRLNHSVQSNKRLAFAELNVHHSQSPERTIEHRQAVKRSETPAMCHKLTECQRYDGTSDIHICHPLRGSVLGCMLSRGSVLSTPPPACGLSCLRHY